ncbi:MAG: hypothetical protein KGJ88_06050 [Verrucomicrobiota bacterium]|nr:hypothetical protein [Verrucomicrobiota bacterium]
MIRFVPWHKHKKPGHGLDDCLPAGSWLNGGMAMEAAEFKRVVIVNSLRRCRLFAGLPAFDLEAIAEVSVLKTLQAGTKSVPNASSGSSASAPQLWVQEPKWTPNNYWVVAYGQVDATASSQQVLCDQYMIAGGVGDDTQTGGVLGTLDPEGLNNNVSPGNNPSSGTVFTMNDQTTRNELRMYLANSRFENFYYFGHGSASSISDWGSDGLTRDQISFALGNVPLGYPIIHAALHPYRFVFLDGCDTAAGNLSEAFGIPAMALSTNNFASQGLESRAFVGFKATKLDLNFATWQGYSLMTGFFLSDWLSGAVNVQTCVNNAENDAHNTGANMDSSAVVYGAADMYSGTITRP